MYSTITPIFASPTLPLFKASLAAGGGGRSSDQFVGHVVWRVYAAHLQQERLMCECFCPGG